MCIEETQDGGFGFCRTVVDTVAERRSAALLNGQPVVGFEIVRSRGAGEIDVTAGASPPTANNFYETPLVLLEGRPMHSRVTGNVWSVRFRVREVWP